MSDGALRCFASLADRFTRRGVDPAPLAKHGLTEELLSRMAAAGGGAAPGPSSACKPGRPSAGAAPSAPDSKLSNQVSTIVSLLSTLCRGSPLVTHVRPLPARVRRHRFCGSLASSLGCRPRGPPIFFSIQSYGCHSRA